ncbi:hypothetical protein TNIN_458281 [Trichonephila inaurata madagascariensis]|uniref:Uncharacterized protein n=1 Tax=Trichonephila inaurata madagascariensis TaxID=2747483 RepID=A0A8X6Y6I9_9ARAC|nr:hypothetical protein TNIN_458281 [Trichonephila inaurata madagascariensis]
MQLTTELSSSSMMAHHSFSYNTAEALASADVFPFCHWSILGNIGSDHLPIKIELKTLRKSILTREMFWNFGKADGPAFAELTEKDFTALPLCHQLNVNWLNFKEIVIRNAKKKPSLEGISSVLKLPTCTMTLVSEL